MSIDDQIGNKGRWWCWGGVTVLFIVGVFGLVSTKPDSQPVLPSELLAAKPKVTVQAPVQHYEPTVKKELRLPKPVQEDKAVQVIAATDLKPSKRERTVTTTLNLETGEAIQYVQEKELPWLGAASDTRLGIYAGLKATREGSEPSIRVAVSKEFMAVKEVRGVIHGSVDFTNSGRTDAFVGVGLEW